MIKTHKPRGYFWTHASSFQQTKEYREVRYEECLAPPAKVLARDPEDRLSEAQRVAKRRRIEKLADDFLNGETLFISSAEPCLQSLRSTFVWNQKSSNDTKFMLPEINRTDESSAVWEDVEGDAEVLARLTASRSEAKDMLSQDTSNVKQESKEAITEVHAQASRPVRRIKALNVTAGPSSDALRQAAVLRARRVQRGASDLSSPTGPSHSHPVGEGPSEPWSDPTHDPDENPGRYRSGQWLNRRKSRFPFGGFDDAADSLDELRLSSIHPPSNTEVLPQPANTHEGYDLLSDEEETNACISQQKASYHTAPEQTVIEAEASAQQDGNQSQDDSQTRLLKKRGIRAVPRKSWTSTNRNSSGLQEFQSPQDAKSGISAITARSAIRKSFQKPAQFNAGKPTKGRRSKSTGKRTPQQPSTSRRTRPTPTTESRGAVDSSISTDQQPRRRSIRRAESKKPAYTIAQCTQQGSTPFMYRIASEPRDARSIAQTVVVNPPLLDISFDHDSSFAPKLNMALVDQHLNKALPTDPGSARRSSAVKKAIRRELRNSGAEITRCDSEPPMSSQLEEPEPVDRRRLDDRKSAVNGSGKLDEPFEKQSVSSQFWPGTQFLLNQAQKDLLTSPEKAAIMEEPAQDCMPHVNDKATTVAPNDAVREPVKQLSQEPLPSTQAMLEGFAGWSTVKKPTRAHRSSAVPTPTAAGKALREPADLPRPSKSSYILSDSAVPASGADRRSSSLRFSISSLDSPLNSANSGALPSKSRSARQLNTSWSSTSLATPVPILKTSGAQTLTNGPRTDGPATSIGPEDSGNYITPQSFTSGPPLSNFQAAQPPSQLLRDDSNLDRTIGELTRDLLGTEDLDGIFSQVGQ